MRRPHSRRGVAALAVAVGGILAAVIPASTSVAYFSPPLLLQVQVHKSATLIAKGVALHVPVTYTCAGTVNQTNLFVSVSEKVGTQITVASGQAAAWCNGATNTTSVTVFGQSASKAFRKGTALATATLAGCTRSFCASQVSNRTISIT